MFPDLSGLVYHPKKQPKNRIDQLIKLYLLVGLIIVKVALIIYYSLQ